MMQSARVLRVARLAAAAAAPLRALPSFPTATAAMRCFSSPAASKVSMSQIKALRDRTSAPITECRDAVAGVLAAGSTDGSDAAVLEAAVEWLRKKGVSTAAKKSGRAASEGLVGVQLGARSGALVEVNSETDFAARNDTFKQLVASITRAASTLAADQQADASLEALQATPCVDPSAASGAQAAVASVITNVVASLRENVQLRRMAALRVSQAGVIGSYVHNAVSLDGVTDGVRMGRQAALVALEAEGGSLSDESRAALQSLANKLAMQVVASTPRFLSRADIPADLLASERAVLTEQAAAPPVHVPGAAKPKAAPKPKDAKQIERMVEGRLNKWMGEVVLLEQPVVVSGDWDAAKPPTVGALLDSTGKAMGGLQLRVTGLQRFLVGEGVQVNKSADSFAKEVADKIAKAQ